jgi:lipopolysaccharide transport system ATP-binding protein
VISRYHKLLYAPPVQAAAVREALREEIARGEMDAPVSPTSAESFASADDDDDDGFFDPNLRADALRYATQGARIDDASITTLEGRPVNVLRAGHSYIYRYRAQFTRNVSLVRFGMMIRTMTGLELGGSASAVHGRGIDLIEAGSAASVAFRFRCLLAAGTYFLNAGVLGRIDAEEVFLDRIVDAAIFRVLPDASRRATALVDFEIEPAVEIEVEVA